MKSKDPKVVEILNDVLTAELTAINQYFVHAEMCRSWGYERLYAQIRKEAIEEMKHAEQMIERVLFLEAVPNVQRLGKISIGETVTEQLKLDLKLELEALPRLNEGIAHCRGTGDNATAAILQAILENEEQHVDWIEAQLTLISQVGEANYLTQQIQSA
ncbi:MAG: bacterioferritin [Candidatus Eisenbacteria bacterium]